MTYRNTLYINLLCGHPCRLHYGHGLKWEGMGRYGIMALAWPPGKHAATSFVR